MRRGDFCGGGEGQGEDSGEECGEEKGEGEDGRDGETEVNVNVTGVLFGGGEVVAQAIQVGWRGVFG